MVFFQALLALLTQSIGRILNTAFGWAMVVLFGKVPANKQLLLTLISLTSILWVLTVIGVIFPRSASFMIGFIKVPSYIDTTPIRLAMLPGAILLPAVVGVWNLLLTDKSARPVGRKDLCKEILRGYPFSLGLSITFITMLLAVPLMKVQELLKRYHAYHIPVMIKPKKYTAVVSELTDLLESKGIHVTPTQASRLVRWPTKLLSVFAVSSVSMFVANELMQLKWEDGEIVVHPSDLLVRGKPEIVTRVHGWIIADLALRSAYFTWHDEAHEIEDKLRQVRKYTDENPRTQTLAIISGKLEEIEHALHKINIPEDEWSVLFRQLLQMQRRVGELQLEDLAAAVASREGNRAFNGNNGSNNGNNGSNNNKNGDGASSSVQIASSADLRPLWERRPAS